MSRVPYSLTAIRSDDDSSGKNIVPYASVSVVDANGNPAQIYLQETGGSPSSHFALNENGFKQIWAEPGRYTITISGGETYDIFLTGDLSDRAQSVATIADLTALTGVADGQQFSVAGYNSGTTIGGGQFVWNASSTATENLVTIFESDAGGVGRFVRTDVTVINTDYSGANRASGNDDTAAIQACLDIDAAIYIPAGKYRINGGLTWSFNALRMTGDGISSWLEGKNAHTITVIEGEADGVIEHLWIDQLDTETTLYDAIHLEAGEMHVNFVDVDFADRHGIYVGAYRTNVFQYSSQACLGGSIYVHPNAYGFCGTDLLFENASLGVPNYGILANGQRAVIKGVSSFNIGNYVWDLAGSYNSGVCASAVFSSSEAGGGGTYGEDAYKVSGSYNAEAAIIARGTVGVAHHITGNSNATAALVSDNCSKQALKITGTNNDVAGGRFSGAGTDTTSPTVEVTGGGTTVRGNAAAPSTATNAALKLTANDCEATGRYNGIVDIDGNRNTVVATMGRVDVGTGGSNFVAGTIAGGTGAALNVSSNSQALAITVDNADTQIATISSASNIGFVRGFGASGDGITVSGDANCLQLSASGSGGNDIVISGSYNQLSIYALGNVVITGTATKNMITGVIRGNLTFDNGSQGNRFYGKVLGTVTDNGSSNTSDHTN